MTPHIASVRIRATIGAAVVAGAALSVAALVLVVSLNRSQTDTVDEGLTQRATDIESLLDGGATPSSVAVESEEESFVQILDTQGNVIASSTNLTGEAATVDTSGPRRSTRRIDPLGSDDFRVYARTTDGARRVIIVVGTSVESLEETQHALIAALAIGLPLLLGVIAALTWVVVGRSLRPVEGIRRRVDEIGAGQLDQRVPVPDNRDEIGRLAVTMNQMLDRLDDAHQRQVRFVSDASHELRTPIAVIRHELEVALSTGTDDWRRTARDVLDEDLRMQRLVDDLLFIARHGHTSTDDAAAGLVDLDDVVIAEAHRHRSRRIDLSNVSAGQVRGRIDDLARVISNILDNAEHYARSTIAIELTSAASRVVVNIDDDGPGIPTDEAETVFERFARTDRSRSRDDGGSGLGLAIARDIISAHHGTITAHRSPTLGGTRITIELPDART